MGSFIVILKTNLVITDVRFELSGIGYTIYDLPCVKVIRGTGLG